MTTTPGSPTPPPVAPSPALDATPVLVVDLDARRAARAEEMAKAGTLEKAFVLGGEKYEVPTELPLYVVELAQAADITGVFELLLSGTHENPRAAARRIVVEFGVTSEDLQALIREVYGVELGE